MHLCMYVLMHVCLMFRFHLPTYLPTYLQTYIPTYLPTYRCIDLVTKYGNDLGSSSKLMQAWDRICDRLEDGNIKVGR